MSCFCKITRITKSRQVLVLFLLLCIAPLFKLQVMRVSEMTIIHNAIDKHLCMVESVKDFSTYWTTNRSFDLSCVQRNGSTSSTRLQFL